MMRGFFLPSNFWSNFEIVRYHPSFTLLLEHQFKDYVPPRPFSKTETFSILKIGSQEHQVASATFSYMAIHNFLHIEVKMLLEIVIADTRFLLWYVTFCESRLYLYYIIDQAVYHNTLILFRSYFIFHQMFKAL